MDSVYVKIGRRIKELRLQKGMTQQDLAEKAEISVSFLSFLEKANRKGSLQTYFDLAKAFDMDLAELFQERNSDRKRTASKMQSFPQLNATEMKAIYKFVKSLRKPR
jgi:transcriptional regulator with XRE-family HTH domain